MIIFSKNIRIKTRLIRTVQLGILLLLLAAVSGCGNKGDLYHPSEHPDSRSANNIEMDKDEYSHVSL